jgi:hypothetical protein
MQKTTLHWSGKDALLLLLIFVLVYGLSIPLQFLVAEVTGELAAFNAADNPAIPQSAMLINHIAKALALMGGVTFSLYVVKKRSWRAIGFRSTTRRWLAICLAIGFIQYPIRLLGARVLLAFLPDWRLGVQNPLFQNDYALPYNLLLLFILTVIVPVSEEVFYRGFLFNWMKQHHPLWAAVFFSSLMFSVSHLVPSQVVMALGLSLVITWVYFKSSSLWTAILIHALNNGIGSLVALYLSYAG